MLAKTQTLVAAFGIIVLSECIRSYVRVPASCFSVRSHVVTVCIEVQIYIAYSYKLSNCRKLCLQLTEFGHILFPQSQCSYKEVKGSQMPRHTREIRENSLSFTLSILLSIFQLFHIIPQIYFTTSISFFRKDYRLALKVILESYFLIPSAN